MTPDQAREILDQAKYWHYRFKFPWGETVPGKAGWAERRDKRHEHFFIPLIKKYGGSLKGKHVLDLGCCQGYWSFEAIKAGAAAVYGVDSSFDFIREANAAATVLGIEGCRFNWAHLEDQEWWNMEDHGQYHVTLFLGTLFHLTDPIHVLRTAMRATAETIVLDGEVLPGDEPRFEIRKRTPGEPTTSRSNMTSDLRTVGTVRALTDLLKDGGFTNLQVLKPAKDMPEDYKKGTTASIIASRS